MFIECICTVIDRPYRLAAYRQFIHWTYSRLGRGIRRVIPACVVTAAHHELPESDGVYTGWQSCSLTLVTCHNKSYVLIILSKIITMSKR